MTIITIFKLLFPTYSECDSIMVSNSDNYFQNIMSLNKLLKSQYLKNFLLECKGASTDVFVLCAPKLGGKAVISGTMLLKDAKHHMTQLSDTRHPSLDHYPLPKASLQNKKDKHMIKH